MKSSPECNAEKVFDLQQRVLVYLQNGMLLEAQNILEHIINWMPRQWPDYIQYFQVLERMGRHCSIIQLGKKYAASIKLSTEGHFFVQLAILRSMIHTENADAIKELTSALLIDLESVAVEAHGDTPLGYKPTLDRPVLRAFLLCILSDQDRKEGKLAAARDQQKKSYQEDPLSNPDIFVRLNPTLQKIDQFFEREDYLQCINLITLNGIQWSENTGLSEKLAASYFSLKNSSQVYALANTLRKSRPNSALAKAKDADPLYIPAWLALGHSFAAMGDHEQTLMSYARIIRHIDDHCVPTLVAMAAEYHRVGKPVLASPFLSIALGVKPDDYGALNELGVLFFLRGEYREALDAFVRAEATSTSRNTRSIIIRNRILTKLKSDHLHGNLPAMIDTIQVAIEDPVLGSTPFIQELAHYLTESMELKRHFLSGAIVGLSCQQDRHKARGLVQRLVSSVNE
ncbi:hypothetical protein PSACC_00450 [Paramicrosporidium saccamoebae]|uniref:Uncharacterized protein n=1 Tax=Paramicrosporidium saccamoebae TaxID=1246581 RepID=A0A2H9TPU2_9FUNG|nr:hypothetical protein PSACC_00450 [Paramicrosporidium saccamoebae]